MEITRHSAVLKPVAKSDTATRAPAASDRFAQIFKNAIKPQHATPAIPAAATLTRLIPARSSLFVQNMSIEQRRSAAQEEGFRPQAAALESHKGAASRVLAQNAVNRG